MVWFAAALPSMAQTVVKETPPTFSVGSIEIEEEEISTLEELLEKVRQRNPQILSAEAKIATAQSELFAANPAFQNRFRQVPANIRQSEKEFALRQAIAERAQVVSTVQVIASGLWCALGAYSRGEEVAKDQEAMLKPLLERAEKMRTISEGAAVLVEAVHGEVQGRRYAQMKLRRQQATTREQLRYLLGDTRGAVHFVPQETMKPLKLAISEREMNDVLDQVWKDGPGISEILAIIGTAMDTRDKAGSLGANGLGGCLFHFVPGSEKVRARNDGFRAANQDVADAVASQASVSLDEVKAKLGSLVREAFGIIRQGEAELESAQEQIKRSTEAYRINDLRLRMNVQGATPADVLTSLSGMDKAYSNYLNSLNDYNFAQARLATILGDFRRVSPNP